MIAKTVAKNVVVIDPKSGGALFYSENSSPEDEITIRAIARNEGLAVRVVDKEELERLIAVYLASAGEQHA